MSGVDFLETLLDGVVAEWRPLGDVTLPTSNIRWRDADSAYRYIDLTSVNIETKAIVETTEIQASNAPSRAQKLVEKDDLIFATTRPTQQRYCLIGEEYSGEVASTGYCVLRAKQEVVLPKWILHWIASRDFKTYVEENQSGSAYPAISDAKVKDYKIPIPCPDNPKKSLEIQAEIVRILDAFIELSTELTNRKKQYNHYRDQLLSFEDGEVEWIPLGDIAKILNGYAFKSSIYSESGIRVIRISDVQKGQMSGANPKYYPTESADEIRKYLLDEGDLVMSLTGNAGRVAMLSKTDLPAGLNQRVACLRPISDVISTRYLFHFLNQYCFENDAMRTPLAVAKRT
jgi:type I restriction enzyme S subunit